MLEKRISTPTAIRRCNLISLLQPYNSNKNKTKTKTMQSVDSTKISLLLQSFLQVCAVVYFSLRPYPQRSRATRHPTALRKSRYPHLQDTVFSKQFSQGLHSSRISQAKFIQVLIFSVLQTTAAVAQQLHSHNSSTI
jgi:hypothetical protein